MSPADSEFVKWLATLGVGGALAGLMFVFYRKDIKQYTELWRIATNSLMDIVKENTASNVKLINLIEQQERNQIRRSDLESMINKGVQDHIISCPAGPLVTRKP